MSPIRINSLSLTIVLSFAIILGRIIYWQFRIPLSLKRQEITQKYNINQILPNQGKIYYHDQSLLAGSERVYRLSLYKPNLKQPLNKVFETIKQQINQLSSTDHSRLDQASQKTTLKWIDLDTPIDPSQYQSLKQVAGLEFKPSLSRYYPESNYFPELYQNIDTFYRRSIYGKSGYFYSNQDALGLPILTQHSLYLEPTNGWDLQTSLNRQVQLVIENTINSGLETYKADHGIAIVLEPHTGRVLAMTAIGSSTPNLNPINYLFEPGSIFKPLTTAAALDSQAIDQNFICPNCDRPFVASGFSINNWDNSFHPQSSLQDIIKNSDNIGMSQIITLLGKDRFLRYFHLLGLDQKTGIDLPNESISPQKPFWSPIDLATASFGQGFAITPIQMIQAFNVLANSGQLARPHLGVSLTNGVSIKKIERLSTTPIFRPPTISQINHILQYAVNNGPAAQFNSQKLEVCAKSGTAQVAIDGQYSSQEAIASYIGYAPCQNAKFTMLVVLVNPKTSTWGSSTAAPLWFALASKISKLL